MANQWQAARISRISQQSPLTKSFALELTHPWPYLAGQHCSIRLTAPNGYQAARDYSLSSAPRGDGYELTIVHAPHGEVSGWFIENAEVGDTIEVLGPIGTHFTWHDEDQQPILLIAGGVGVTPLMSILREHRLSGSSAPLRLFYSARTYEDIIFKSELLDTPAPNEQIAFTLVESWPSDWPHYRGLIEASMLTWQHMPTARVYVCGPNGFVEAATRILIAHCGVSPDNIKTERFG